MLRAMVATLAVLLSALVAVADRLPYTWERAEAANIVAVWNRGNLLAKEDGTFRLGPPGTVFKGDPQTIPADMTYSPRLATAIKRIADGRGAILFLTVSPMSLDIAGDLADIEVSDVTLRVVRYTLDQIALQQKWHELPVKEQVELSDVIVAGRCDTMAHKTPATYFVHPRVVYRGMIKGRQLSVLRPLQGEIEGEALFFLERSFASYPEFAVMHAVPLAKAAPYLEILGASRQVGRPEQQDPKAGTTSPESRE